MKKEKITVWDYFGGGILQDPVKYEVDAWCLQGKTGFRAFFFLHDNDFLYEAEGDDGHWWIVRRMHKHWIKEFKKVVNSNRRKGVIKMSMSEHDLEEIEQEMNTEEEDHDNDDELELIGLNDPIELVLW
jgi:hypothetical protein